MTRTNVVRLMAAALLPLTAPGVQAQLLLEEEEEGIELRGVARLVETGAGTCNVSEARETAASYERKKANHGRPIDIWRLDFSVYNGSGEPLEHLIADYRIASENPPCTDWSWPETGRYPDLIGWGGVAGLIQRTGSRNPTAPGETLTDTKYIFALHQHEPRFETGSVDFSFAADAPGAAPPPSADRREVCLQGPSAYPCWMELADQPECYIWVQRHVNPTVTWSGECSDGYAQGTGTIGYSYRRGGRLPMVDRTAHGLLVDGKRQGHWVTRLASGKSFEGPYVGGREHGHWVRPHPRGGESEGLMIHGKQRGDWVQREPDGTVRKGPLHTDDEGALRYVRQHGIWVSWLPGGTIHEWSMVRGSREGSWLRWEPDGRVSEYSYVADALHGVTVYCWPEETTVMPACCCWNPRHRRGDIASPARR
ncbi:toxin-antitoxin system YwqK family antitoxin [Candidatus Palauibacter sp.]|uniref:toxin-antitoxin system YwqK family antitoxin n=1 Tax=Candidatus Palauibacter sp. TaxID=3101350 RepID=UPI003AF294B9